MSYVVPATLATPQDYVDWTDESPPDAIMSILRGCSTLVLEATRGVGYDTDALTGLATDTTVKDALRDATCIQAAAWAALGINPATGGVLQSSKAVKSKKLATASFEYSETELRAATSARAAAYSSLVPEAVTYLRVRGLGPTSAVSHT